MNNIKFDFDDILLVPAEETTINSRSEVDPYYHNEFEHLPIFSAPMTMVAGEKNAIEFSMNKINVCFPRGVNYPINNFGYFHSLSLDEFYRVFVEGKFVPDSIFKNNSNDRKSYVLIDIANGHMKKLVDAIKAVKEKYGDRLVIMCGNVAHPETYRRLSDAGADLVRVGIGNGGSCFIDNTKVNLKNGMLKNIQDLEIGDQVLTHKGRYKEVIAKFRKHIKNEDLISINGLICTKEHKFLVVKQIDKYIINNDNYLDYAFWLEAENIDENIHFVLEQE